MALTGLILSGSCQKEEIDLVSPEQPAASSGGNSIKLGKKLENPYSVTNMKKAWKNLHGSPNSKINGDDLDVTTSHLYVKFKPKDDMEFSLLKRDTTITLFTYPLDYEIDRTGDHYHDPEVPAELPTYQYASVNFNYKFPDVAYDILEELYIPEEVEGVVNGRSTKKVAVDALVEEALRITGNLEEENETSSNGRVMSSWRPSGRINVWDDARTIATIEGNWAPVVGAEVRATRWFTTHKGITNSQGSYSCDGTFDRPANYSIQWDKYHFSVRSGTFGQAELLGPKQEGAWNANLGMFRAIGVRDPQQYYALIFQGAHDYYYGNRFGLSVPPLNSTLHPQVKIAADITARQNRKPNHAAMYARTGGIFPSIYIRSWGERSDDVYATTTHELAHAAHWNMDRNSFEILVAMANAGYSFTIKDIPSSNAVIESWAQGVEWQFARQRYRIFLGNPNYEYGARTFDGGNYQNQMIAPFNRTASDLIYTPIVVDLIDNENQRVTRGGGSVMFPQDRVSGFNIQQIEGGLRGARSWDMWRNQMISRHGSNPTIGFINELYSNWY